MNDNRLAELKDKYKDRNLLEELAWGAYANHSGYTSKQNGEFLNWLCMSAYKALKERPQGEWITDIDNVPLCKNCGEIALQRVYVRTPQLLEEVSMVKSNFCPNCGADMRGGRE